RNAYFNLHKLGAAAREYLPDFYGAMDDGTNTGDTTDRLYVSWELTSPAAVAAARGDVIGFDAATVRDAGAAVVLDRVDDEPVASGGRPAPGGPLPVAAAPRTEAARAPDPAARPRVRAGGRGASTRRARRRPARRRPARSG